MNNNVISYAKNELLKFDAIMFEPSSHKYFINNMECVSVTTLLNTYVKEFDSLYWSQYKASRLNISQEKVLDSWKVINEVACNKGNTLHKYLEYKISNLPIPGNMNINEISNLKLQADTFINDSKKYLILISSEFRLFDIDFLVAGTADALFFNTIAQEYQIWDWKSNKRMLMSSRNKLINGLEFLDDCDFILHSLQLSFYKVLVELNTNIKIGDCYINWFNEFNSSYKPIKTIDFSNLIINLVLKNRYAKLQEVIGNNLLVA